MKCGLIARLMLDGPLSTRHGPAYLLMRESGTFNTFVPTRYRVGAGHLSMSRPLPRVSVSSGFRRLMAAALTLPVRPAAGPRFSSDTNVTETPLSAMQLKVVHFESTTPNEFSYRGK